MKIALGIEHLDPRRGGAEKYGWELSHWLADNGHELDVFTCSAPGNASEKINIHLLDVKKARGRSRQERFSAAFSDAVSGRGYDIVNGFNHVHPGDLLMLHGGVHRAFEYFNALSAPSSFARSLKRFSYKVFPKYAALRHNEVLQFGDPARRFACVSERIARDMETYFPSCRGRVHVVRLGLDATAGDAADTGEHRSNRRAALDLPPDALIGLFVSHNFRLKGLHDLIRCLPLVQKKLDRELVVVVAGRGHAGSYIRLARKTGVAGSVRFVGPVEKMNSLYAVADALLHPTYYDSCATVCLEAMAHGLPVMTSRNNGASELMEEGTGSTLVEMPCSRQELADAVSKVFSDGYREAARAHHPAMIAPYTPERSYRTMLGIYEQIVNEKTRRAQEILDI
ncbi:MAG: glycosyltransferase family 4 protein [Verrucomicrobia bacterium]|nr:glycosyltransferase family 4 protein [Verrucomicrobiota bacterium]